MTPLQFESAHQHEWSELEAFVESVLGPARGLANAGSDITGDRAALLYRRACEHLAIARARAYPAYLVERLERVTVRAHQLIYRRRDFGVAALRNFIARGFPGAVRQHAPYVAVAAVAFALPTLVLGVLVYSRPELILSVVTPETAASFREMYAPEATSIGRPRNASTDWMMFGYYIRNNVGVSFQCFAAGLFAGIGSLFFLAFNGALGGAVGGFLTAHGLSSTFFPFVATHSSFELTAIVLSGAAGLRLGREVVAPGRLTRAQALVAAARDTAPLIYGVTGMLFVAAGIEAFWSSANWLPATLKYSVAAVCWTAVIGYLVLQGRRVR